MQKPFPQQHIITIGVGALLLCVLAAYSNIFHNAFLLDDEFLIQKNRYLTSFGFLPFIFTSSSTSGAAGIDSFYRPLQTVIYLITHQLAGLSAPAFHIPNLILHLFNTCLVVVLGLRLGMARLPVFIAAALWALHPMHTEAVTYMSATADTLYSFFCLCGLAIITQGITGRTMLLACCAFILALLSKETALAFPLLVLACIYRNDVHRHTIAPYLKTWPLWVIALGYVILRMTILKLNGLDFYKVQNIYTEHFFVRFFTFAATLPDYLALIFYPANLHFDRAFPVYADASSIKVIIGIAIFILCTSIVLYSFIRKKTSAAWVCITWGLLWFGFAHLLHTGLLIPVNAFFLEHWMYLPSIGLFLALCEHGVHSINQLKSDTAQTLGLCVVIIIAGTLGILTYQQNAVWATPISFYSNILKNGGEKARVHNNIAMAYDDAGDTASAITHYTRAIEIEDNYAQTRYNLAQVLLKISPTNAPQAMHHLQRAVEINPDFFQAYKVMGQLYQRQGDTEKAKENQLKFLNLMKKYLQY
ncbi:MAG: tetratricopeptide repeat protein [Alphaproteobacteria bacterium]|nr:tetratricopeptide repeat protein [Alphaproteobacteria bacterium]